MKTKSQAAAAATATATTTTTTNRLLLLLPVTNETSCCLFVVFLVFLYGIVLFAWPACLGIMSL